MEASRKSRAVLPIVGPTSLAPAALPDRLQFPDYKLSQRTPNQPPTVALPCAALRCIALRCVAAAADLLSWMQSQLTLCVFFIFFVFFSFTCACVHVRVRGVITDCRPWLGAVW